MSRGGLLVPRAHQRAGHPLLQGHRLGKWRACHGCPAERRRSCAYTESAAPAWCGPSGGGGLRFDAAPPSPCARFKRPAGNGEPSMFAFVVSRGVQLVGGAEGGGAAVVEGTGGAAGRAGGAGVASVLDQRNMEGVHLGGGRLRLKEGVRRIR